jgi:hypothetical protein
MQCLYVLHASDAVGLQACRIISTTKNGVDLTKRSIVRNNKKQYETVGNNMTDNEKEQVALTEEDRSAAVLRGSYLAKNFPDIWYGQEMKKMKKKDESEIMTAILKRRLGKQ